MYIYKSVSINGPSFFVYLKYCFLAIVLTLFSGVALADTIDINTADVKILQTLPGIGKKKAARIVTYREQNGPFKYVHELVRVSGISKKLLQKIKPYVSIGNTVSKLTDETIHILAAKNSNSQYM